MWYVFIAAMQRLLGLSNGILVAVSIPEEFSIDLDELNEVIDQAVNRAQCVNEQLLQFFLLQLFFSLLFKYSDHVR